MRQKLVVRRAGKLGAVAAAGAAALIALAPAAFADTSQASANALTITLVPITTGIESASNPGGQPPVSAGDQPALSILANEHDITVGAAQQTATAFGNGYSAACAGGFGNGGQLQIGSDGTCSLNSGEAGGITIGGANGMGLLEVNAAVESCAASSTSPPVAAAQELNLVIAGSPVALPPTVPPNDVIIPGVLELNRQSVSGGQIKATALYVPLLGLSIGNVTCGPNAQTSPTSVFPVKSLPIVGGTAAVCIAGGLVWWRRRGRRLASV